MYQLIGSIILSAAILAAGILNFFANRSSSDEHVEIILEEPPAKVEVKQRNGTDCKAHKGDVVCVPTHQWVTLVNPDPVASQNRVLSAGETCSINYGGTLTVIGVEDKQVLVRYDYLHETAGAMCPSGGIFYLPTEALYGMDAAYERATRKAEDERARVRQHLMH